LENIFGGSELLGPPVKSATGEKERGNVERGEEEPRSRKRLVTMIIICADILPL